MNWLKSILASAVYGDRVSIVPYSLRADWPRRMFLKRLLIDLSVDCVLDVGANVGQYGGELRRIGYKGQIVSFEPDPIAYSKLVARTVGDPRWEAINLALGDRTGVLPFNLMAVSLFNSFLNPTADETERFTGANEVVQTVDVSVMRLSDVLPDLKARLAVDRVFLKMDTQGFDQQVFAGASDVWNQITAFQSEIGIKKLYSGVKSWHDQIEAYQLAGFDLVGMFAVNAEDQELIEFDSYFRSKAP